jgi:PST family polysaccharide transporter
MSPVESSPGEPTFDVPLTDDPRASEGGSEGGNSSIDASSIATKTARGGLLLATRSGVVQCLQLGSSILIARFIFPDAYGALTVALAAVGFGRYVGDLGVATSFLPLPTLDSRLFQTGALIALVLAIAEASGLVALAPLLAASLHGPSYSAEIIRLLAVCLVVEALRFGPMVSLNRELRFGRYGALSLTETLILYVTQIGLLILGAGIWALVAGQLARSILGTTVYIWKGGGLTFPLYRARLSPIVRRAIPYQGPLVIAAAGGLLFPVALTFVLTARDIGLWGWATVLATPISAVVTIVSSVTLPGLARLRANDPAVVARAAQLMVRASVIVPAAGAGALLGFAGPLVALVFGRRWHPALSAAEVCLFGVVPATLSAFLAAVLESDQRAKARVVGILVAQLVGLAIVVPVAREFGVAGAAFVPFVAVPLIDVAVLGAMARLDFRRAALNGVVAFGATAAVTFLLARLATSLPLLGLCALAAVAPILVIIWYTDRAAARTVLQYGVPLPRRVAAFLGMGAS